MNERAVDYQQQLEKSNRALQNAREEIQINAQKLKALEEIKQSQEAKQPEPIKRKKSRRKNKT